ncbi:unnamed protein product, partial [Effrenium voratum]
KGRKNKKEQKPVVKQASAQRVRKKKTEEGEFQGEAQLAPVEPEPSPTHAPVPDVPPQVSHVVEVTQDMPRAPKVRREKQCEKPKVDPDTKCMESWEDWEDLCDSEPGSTALGDHDIHQDASSSTRSSPAYGHRPSPVVAPPWLLCTSKRGTQQYCK